MDKSELIARLTAEEEERWLLSRVWDKAEQCRGRNIPTHTAFLSPHEQTLVKKLLPHLGGDNAVFFGGYEGAERAQLHFLPDWAETAEVEAVCAIRAVWHESETLTHRDILGSLMGAGITRETVGDILINGKEHRADILVTDTMAPYLMEHWNSAGRVRLHLSLLPLEEVEPPEIAVKEVRDTVSSLRLDNVTAAAFSLSRGRAQEAVESGKVEVNWVSVTKGDKPVAQGDVITVRGLGKCELTTVGSPNKKGRLPIVVKRYV